ncbi:MAG: hypothetical protein J0M04_07690 [Verrucomicrobia bacterium]|nr:hypothetical protein [Verrucomicrobiota bacterium]
MKSKFITIPYLFVLLFGVTWGQGFDPDCLDAAIDREAKNIPANSQHLPEGSEVGVPPAVVSAAGVEFVDAWKLYRRVTAAESRVEPETPARKSDKLINAHVEWERFNDLLKRTVESTTAPDPSEYDHYTYSSLDWCGDGAMTFLSRKRNGLALAMLRNGRNVEALQVLVSMRSQKAELLLPAFGIDSETFRIGEWLAKKTSPAQMCVTGGDKTARMLMDWIDFRFDAEMDRWRIRRETNCYDLPRDEPFYPNAEIVGLLREGNGVADKTKSRIVDHITKKELSRTSAELWLRSLPKGSEKWMVPVAREGLDDPLNRVRKRSAAALKAAGVEFAPPTIRPDPRFRILVNGEKWPGGLGYKATLSLSIQAEKGGCACGFKEILNGIATCDADRFFENGDVKSAEVYDYPYVWGPITLPIDFESIGTVNIETKSLTIAPVFPDRTTNPEDRTYAVELDRFQEGQTTDGSINCRAVKDHEPCIYPNVSPGEYWLRLRHPGAVLENRRRITIGKDDEVVRPHLRQGSSLVVPVDWPEASDPEKLPPELGRIFAGLGHGWHDNLRRIVTIKGDGVREIKEYIATPEAANGRFPRSVIFPYLPPGKYIVESPERTIDPNGIHPGCSIRPSSIEAEIRDNSPPFVITKPLKIHYTVRK